jgi:oligosaccharide repeat unit polymerase
VDNTKLLILNAALYIGSFIIYQIKVKKFTLGSFVLLFYAIIASGSIDLFYNTDLIVGYSDRILTIFPFIYLYVVLMMIFFPILKFSNNKNNNFILANRQFIIIVSSLSILFAILFLLLKVRTFSFDLASFAENYIDHTDAQSTKTVGFGFSNFVGISWGILSEFLLLLIVYNILYIKKKPLIYGLLFGVIVNLLYELSIGARIRLFNFILDLPLVYLVFKEHLSKRMRKSLIYTFIYIGGLFIFSGYMISAGRSQGKTYSIMLTVEDYLCQSFINFNTYGLDAGGTREGEQVAELFVRLSGKDVAANSMIRRDKFWYLNVDNSIFYTFVGDFTIDFGPVFAFFLLLFLSIIFIRLLSQKQKGYHLGHILLLFLVYKICMHGFSLWSYAGIGGNLLVLIYFFLFYYFKRDSVKKIL